MRTNGFFAILCAVSVVLSGGSDGAEENPFLAAAYRTIALYRPDIDVGGLTPRHLRYSKKVPYPDGSNTTERFNVVFATGLVGNEGSQVSAGDKVSVLLHADGMSKSNDVSTCYHVSMDDADPCLAVSDVWRGLGGACEGSPFDWPSKVTAPDMDRFIDYARGTMPDTADVAQMWVFDVSVRWDFDSVGQLRGVSAGVIFLPSNTIYHTEEQLPKTQRQGGQRPVTAERKGESVGMFARIRLFHGGSRYVVNRVIVEQDVSQVSNDMFVGRVRMSPPTPLVETRDVRCPSLWSTGDAVSAEEIEGVRMYESDQQGGGEVRNGD